MVYWNRPYSCLASPDSHATLSRHNERALQPLTESGEYGLCHTDPIGGAFISKPEQQNALMSTAASENKLAKVLVVGHHDAPLKGGPVKDCGIIGLRHNLGNGDHVVTSAPKELGNPGTGRFVHDESHGGVAYSGGLRAKISSSARTSAAKASAARMSSR